MKVTKHIQAPTLRVDGASVIAALASSTTPDTYVTVRFEAGIHFGTTASKNVGVTKCMMPGTPIVAASATARRSFGARSPVTIGTASRVTGVDGNLG